MAKTTPRMKDIDATLPPRVTAVEGSLSTLTPRVTTIETKYTPSGVLGRTNGAAVPAGYVGETIAAAGGFFQAYDNNNYSPMATIPGCSITLTPGIWIIQTNGYTSISPPISGGNLAAGVWVAIFKPTGSVILTWTQSRAVEASYQEHPMSLSCLVNISASTTYSVAGRGTDSGGQAIYINYFNATRIA